MADTIITDTKPLLTKNEACAYLHIHKQTFDRWAAAGQLPDPVITCGQRKYFRRTDLDAIAYGDTSE